ncbi:hypothetical protein ACWEOA_30390 [Streptomyces sp. NPDC004457]
MRGKANATLIALAIAAGSVMFSTPAASAAAASFYCDSSGYTALNVPMQRCTSLSNGVLYVLQASNGNVTTGYDKTGGSAISAQLGYSRGGTSHYAGAVSISSGQNKSHTWALSESSYCTSTIGLLSYSGGTYQTPSSHC